MQVIYAIKYKESHILSLIILHQSTEKYNQQLKFLLLSIQVSFTYLDTQIFAQPSQILVKNYRSKRGLKLTWMYFKFNNPFPISGEKYLRGIFSFPTKGRALGAQLVEWAETENRLCKRAWHKAGIPLKRCC